MTGNIYCTATSISTWSSDTSDDILCRQIIMCLLRILNTTCVATANQRHAEWRPRYLAHTHTHTRWPISIMLNRPRYLANTIILHTTEHKHLQTQPAYDANASGNNAFSKNLKAKYVMSVSSLITHSHIFSGSRPNLAHCIPKVQEWSLA